MLSLAAASQPARDLQGYGREPPEFRWPGGGLLAVNFAINIEEGSEPNMLDGDGASTAALCECPSDAPAGVRDLAAESMFEYGSRVGVWRVLRAFRSRGVPATAFACALALERLPEVAEYQVQVHVTRRGSYLICSHLIFYYSCTRCKCMSSRRGSFRLRTSPALRTRW